MVVAKEIKKTNAKAPAADPVQDGAIGAGLGAALGTMVAVAATGPFGIVFPIIGAGIGSPLALYGLKAWRLRHADEARKKAQRR